MLASKWPFKDFLQVCLGLSEDESKGSLLKVRFHTPRPNCVVVNNGVVLLMYHLNDIAAN